MREDEATSDRHRGTLIGFWASKDERQLVDRLKRRLKLASRAAVIRQALRFLADEEAH